MARAKLKLKAKAIKLRKQGKSYGEIQCKVPVSSGSLSFWLRDIKLTNKQINRLDEKGEKDRQKATEAAKRYFRRIREDLLKEACRDFKEIELDKNSLALVGAALYWAEGDKSRGTTRFTNSDPKMVKIYLRWLKEVLRVPRKSLRFSIHVYIDNGPSYEQVQNYWRKITQCQYDAFDKPQINTYPKSSKKTKKNYLPYGVLHIRVRGTQKYAARYQVLAEKIGRKQNFI